MAVVIGTVYAANAALTRQEPKEMIDVTLNYSKLRYISDSYTFAVDAIGTDDAINFFKIPKGARVIEMMLTIPEDDASGQFNIGWLASEEEDENGSAIEAADADGFYVNTVADFGEAALSRLAIAASRPGYRKKFEAEVQVQADCAEVTTAMDGKTMFIEAYIVVE